MSFLTRTTFRASAVVPRLRAERRAFHLTRTRAALSESDRSKGLQPPFATPPPLSNAQAWRTARLTAGPDRDDVEKEIDQHKNEQLKQQKAGKGEWKGELASNSESAIKADRGEMKATDENISKMQEETAKAHAAEHEEAK